MSRSLSECLLFCGIFFFFLVGHSEAIATGLDFKVAASFTGKAIVLHFPHPHWNEILIF